MPLNKADHIINQLAAVDDFFSDPAITCWEKKQGNLSIYLFAQVFSSVENLKKDYKMIRDHVAISFQSQGLESDGERWNLYIFYIVEEKVPHVLKLEIEHDKFSTRKIVCSGVTGAINDQVITALIDGELFDFDISKRAQPKINLSALLAKDFPKVAAALKSIGGKDNVTALDPLLKTLEP